MKKLIKKIISGFYRTHRRILKFDSGITLNISEIKQNTNYILEVKNEPNFNVTDEHQDIILKDLKKMFPNNKIILIVSDVGNRHLLKQCCECKLTRVILNEKMK